MLVGKNRWAKVQIQRFVQFQWATEGTVTVTGVFGRVDQAKLTRYLLDIQFLDNIRLDCLQMATMCDEIADQISGTVDASQACIAGVESFIVAGTALPRKLPPSPAASAVYISLAALQLENIVLAYSTLGPSGLVRQFHHEADLWRFSAIDVARMADFGRLALPELERSGYFYELKLFSKTVPIPSGQPVATGQFFVTKVLSTWNEIGRSS